MTGLTFIDSVGRKLLDQLQYFFQMLLMLYLSVRATLKNQSHGLRTIFGILSLQIFYTGVNALPLVTVLAMATGCVVALQGVQLSILGGVSMIGQLLVVFVVREVGPLLTALVVIARSGTAMASELGNMRANREIEALESMGINPLSFIVFPRLVGGLISVLCLSLYFIFISLLGGFLVAKFAHDISFNYYMTLILNSLTFNDAYLFLIKNTFGGVMIFAISCQQGFSVRKSPTEVPAVTTQAVVKSILFVVVFNSSVTVLFYFKDYLFSGLL